LQVVRVGYPEQGMTDPFGYLLPEESPDR